MRIDRSQPEPAPDRGMTTLMGAVVLLSVLLVVGALLATAAMTNVEGELNDAERAAAQKTVSGNQWSGSIGDLIRLSKTRAGASDVRARVNVTVETHSRVIGDELRQLELEVVGGKSMFRDTSRSSLRSVTVKSDTGPDRDITADATEWTVERDGTHLTIGFDSTYDPKQGDSVVLVFDDVSNPEQPGGYGVRARANEQGNWHQGEITIEQPVAPVGVRRAP